MADQQEIRRALTILRKERSHIGRPHSRHHSNTDEDNNNRDRALKGLCGQCANLIINFESSQGRNKVVLRCHASRFPLTLYKNTWLGETAQCDKFESKEPKTEPSTAPPISPV